MSITVYETEATRLQRKISFIGIRQSFLGRSLEHLLLRTHLAGLQERTAVASGLALRGRWVVPVVATAAFVAVIA